MLNGKYTKTNRILLIYSKLINGEAINKKEMCKMCNVSEKTIQRDIEDIRAYFHNNQISIDSKNIVYIPNKKGYTLDNRDKNLSKEGMLVVIKILLESRAFCKSELNYLTKCILDQIDVEHRNHIKDMIGNELLNYVPLEHGDSLISKIWSLSNLIKNKDMVKITYIKMNRLEIKRIVKPVSIIFSEYYFYLIAYIDEFDSPSVFRIDRIKKHKSIGEKFYIPYSERFEDGEFRKRVQFMYPGKLLKIKLKYTGASIEAILDRLPTGRIIEKSEGNYLVEAEVYGKGIIMWILSQMQFIEVVEPKELRQEIKEIIISIKNKYD